MTRRNIQFYRNGSIKQVASTSDMISAMQNLASDTTLNDGEIILGRYKIGANGTALTMVGVVNTIGSTKKINIIANNAMLDEKGSEIINNLNGSAAVAEIDTNGNAQVLKIYALNQVQGTIDTDTTKVVTIFLDQMNPMSETNRLITRDTLTNAIQSIQGAGLIVNENGEITIKDNNAPTDVITRGQVTERINNKIGELDNSDITIASVDGNDVVSIRKKLTQVDGLVQSSDDTENIITLAKVAKTGSSDDISYNDTTLTEKLNRLSELQARQYVAGDGINLATTGSVTEKSISVKIDTNDNVLSTSANGLGATIGLKLNSDNAIQLVGKNGTHISTIDASAFLSDKFVTEGEVQGNMLILKYNNGTQSIQTDVSNLLNVYRVETNGAINLDTDNNNTFSHKTIFSPAPAPVTPSISGSTLTLPEINVNKYGHISSVNLVDVTLPTYLKSIQVGSNVLTSNNIQFVGGTKTSVQYNTSANTIQINHATVETITRNSSINVPYTEAIQGFAIQTQTYAIQDGHITQVTTTTNNLKFPFNLNNVVTSIQGSGATNANNEDYIKTEATRDTNDSHKYKITPKLLIYNPDNDTNGLLTNSNIGNMIQNVSYTVASLEQSPISVSKQGNEYTVGLSLAANDNLLKVVNGKLTISDTIDCGSTLTFNN